MLRSAVSFKFGAALYNALSSSPVYSDPLTEEPWAFLGREFRDCYGVEGLAMLGTQMRSTALFTYRRNFEALPQSSICTDTGFGCMVRAAQMLAAQCLLKLDYTRRGVAWPADLDESPEQAAEVLRLFQDIVDAPLSIHGLITEGLRLGRMTTGDRFGPTSIGLAMAARWSAFAPLGSVMYVATDSTVYIESVRRLTTSSDGVFKPLFLYVPLRLGMGAEVTPAFFGPLLELFRVPQFLGIVGGKARTALYFVGSQGDRLFHLDPHRVQDCLVIPDDNESPAFAAAISSCLCSNPRSMVTARLDPSLALGFLLPDQESLTDLFARLDDSRTRFGVSLFYVQDGRAPADMPASDANLDFEHDFELV